MGDRCPKCGASGFSIYSETTLVHGPNNIITYHCTNCGHSWTNEPDMSTAKEASGVQSFSKPAVAFAVPCLLCGEASEAVPYFVTNAAFICDRCKSVWKEFLARRAAKEE